MTMGFVDQQVDASAAAAAVTFVGTTHGKFTTAQAGDYFDNGSIGHFSHDIEDLYQFYSTPNQDSNRPGGEPFTERVQYMFHSNQLGYSRDPLRGQPRPVHQRRWPRIHQQRLSGDRLSGAQREGCWRHVRAWQSDH